MKKFPAPLSPLNPAALTIAGSDSGGNAGIQADLRAFHCFGVHGCTAITALTAQNPSGVTHIQPTTTTNLTAQLDQIFAAYTLGGIKCGMLVNATLIRVVHRAMKKYQPCNLVIDPVMVATSSAMLLQEEAADALCKLLPCATLITPNIPEAEHLLGSPIKTFKEMKRAAETLAERFNTQVLLKGGHAVIAGRDVLCLKDGLYVLELPKISKPLSTHGTGCSLSAAIAANLARGRDLLDAVTCAKRYVYQAIKNAVPVGEHCAVLGFCEETALD